MYYTVFVLILVVFVFGEFSFTDSCLSTHVASPSGFPAEIRGWPALSTVLFTICCCKLGFNFFS